MALFNSILHVPHLHVMDATITVGIYTVGTNGGKWGVWDLGSVARKGTRMDPERLAQCIPRQVVMIVLYNCTGYPRETCEEVSGYRGRYLGT